MAPVDRRHSTGEAPAVAKRFRCPHCSNIESAEQSPDRPLSVTCSKCQQRFRIPKLDGPGRVQTSYHQKLVNQQIQKEVEVSRTESEKEKLDRIVRERRFGDYDILDELGKGGMGVVFKAFHRHLKRIVALKVVLPDLDDKETMLKRFKREAELHARLDHPNVVRVYDSGEIDGVHYFAMNFIQGTQLSRLMGSPEFTVRHRVDVARQIAEALDHAHGHGVVHRDIKPDNIIVEKGWVATLVDFGIAKPTDMSGRENITRQGLAIGTPHYMAPEQFRTQLGEVGPRSDVYSLGAVLYHALRGSPPFEADTAHKVLIAAATQDPPSLRGEKTPSLEPISDDLWAVVQKAMRKKPEERYASAREFADDLRRLNDGAEVHARPLSGRERLRRRIAKNERNIGVYLTIAATVAPLLLCILLGVALGATTAGFATLLSGAVAGMAAVVVAAWSFLVKPAQARARFAPKATGALPEEIGATADEV